MFTEIANLLSEKERLPSQNSPQHQLLLLMANMTKQGYEILVSLTVTCFCKVDSGWLLLSAGKRSHSLPIKETDVC